MKSPALIVAAVFAAFALGAWAGYDHGQSTVPPTTDPTFCEPLDGSTHEPERPA